MAEYKSFHYLMHQVPDSIKPVYVTGPEPLKFEELYSPRDGIKLIFTGEKSYWRTRDRIEYKIYEYRSKQIVFITCKNIDSSDIYRTIFLSLPYLYFEVEAKAQGNREKLLKKKDQKLTGEGLYKATADYILARLNITADPLPWPKFSETSTGNEETSTGPVSTVGPVERMVTFNKLSSDIYEILEIEKPTHIDNLESIQGLKLAPTDCNTGNTKEEDKVATSETAPVNADTAQSTEQIKGALKELSKTTVAESITTEVTIPMEKPIVTKPNSKKVSSDIKGTTVEKGVTEKGKGSKSLAAPKKGLAVSPTVTDSGGTSSIGPMKKNAKISSKKVVPV